MGAEGSRFYNDEDDEYSNYTPRSRGSSQSAQQATSTTVDITSEFAAIRKYSVSTYTVTHKDLSTNNIILLHVRK
jgi:hypothetical protein